MLRALQTMVHTHTKTDFMVMTDTPISQKNDCSIQQTQQTSNLKATRSRNQPPLRSHSYRSLTLPPIPTTPASTTPACPSRRSITRRCIRSSPFHGIIIFAPIRIRVIITPILITIMKGIAVRRAGPVVTGTVVISGGV